MLMIFNLPEDHFPDLYIVRLVQTGNDLVAFPKDPSFDRKTDDPPEPWKGHETSFRGKNDLS